MPKPHTHSHFHKATKLHRCLYSIDWLHVDWSPIPYLFMMGTAAINMLNLNFRNVGAVQLYYAVKLWCVTSEEDMYRKMSPQRVTPRSSLRAALYGFTDFPTK